jgi:hydroxyacylglutathione hydrolase
MIVDMLVVGPLQCNCVILGDQLSKTAIVVDPGDEVDRIVEALARHELRAVAIVTTHAHIDHVGGIADLKARTGAPALLHRADEPLYQALAEQAEWLGVSPPEVAKIDGGLDATTRLSVGTAAVTVLHTPGHSPGSVCFQIADQRLVLSGDTLFAGSIGRTDLWGGSFEQIIASIRTQLLALPDETSVIPGHGQATTIGQERRSNPFLT